MMDEQEAARREIQSFSDKIQKCVEKIEGRMGELSALEKECAAQERSLRRTERELPVLGREVHRWRKSGHVRGAGLAKRLRRATGNEQKLKEKLDALMEQRRAEKEQCAKNFKEFECGQLLLTREKANIEQKEKDIERLEGIIAQHQCYVKKMSQENKKLQT